MSFSLSDSISRDGATTVHLMDPLRDPRWQSFLNRHPFASIFHTSQWLSTLQRTYGFVPRVITLSSANEPLQNAIVYCKVNSWITGDRLISVPFSDHCRPLVEDPASLKELLHAFASERKTDNCKFAELRPGPEFQLPIAEGFAAGKRFYFHAVNLDRGLETIWRSFDKSCVQRRIRRAERSGVSCQEGRDQELILVFYRLLSLTRQRHGIPPQPIEWIQNLADALGSSLVIRVAYAQGMPIAGILTVSHKNTMVYKYGCSEAQYHHLGAMPLLFWRAIEDAFSKGITEFDLGRSDLDNPGLINFKENWGARREMLTYYQSPEPLNTGREDHTFARAVLRRTPNRILRLAGRYLYRHLA